tara:strand:+ start:6981 stop:7979 length:999 start_codon:yes stop_codon:yes gene_type:complete
MNRSKIIGATALASVMVAGAAQAEMSISGLFAGAVTDSGGGGVAHSVSTNSIYVNYSDSMDNGMGVAVAMSVTAAGIKTDVNIDTGMGTVALGNGVDSAVDGMDGSPACFSLNLCGSALNANYNDGDTISGNSIGYKNSMGGISFAITRGMETSGSAATAGVCIDALGTIAATVAGSDCADQHNASYSRLTGTDATEGMEAVMSYAASTTIMGLTVKGGMSQIDNKGATADTDPSFMTAAYSIAGLDLGYAMYDGDNGGEETQMGVGTSLMGMNVGVTFASADLATDVDYTRVSVGKGMGAASFGVDYTETDTAGGTASDTEAWQFTYIVGF